MNKRYRLGELEEAVSEMEELIGLEDDIAAVSYTHLIHRLPFFSTRTGRQALAPFILRTKTIISL